MTEQLQAGAPFATSQAPVAPYIEHVLNPDARVLWRSPTSIQIELGTRRIVLDHVTSAHVSALTAPRAPERTAVDDDLDGAREGLARRGFLVPAAAPRRHVGAPRLAREIGAVRSRKGDQAAAVVTRRQESVVVVQGPGRLSVLIGSLLASAGVGHVYVQGGGLAQLHHCAPGGLIAADEGRPFDQAAADALHRVAPEVAAGPPEPQVPVDLTVLASGAISDPELSARLHADGHTHLFAWAGGDRAIVGPTVIPGLTSCLRCADESRRERDPAWPLLSAQLAVPPRYPTASDICLVVTTAGVAAAQALALLDGEPVATLEGSLEFEPPDWRLRRRSWPRHSACACSDERNL